MTPEGAVVDACLGYLRIRHINAWRNNSGAVKHERSNGSHGFIRFGKVGSADILGCLPDGRFLAVECKAGRNGLTNQQREFLDNINKCNGLAICVRSVDDLIQVFEEQGY